MTYVTKPPRRGGLRRADGRGALMPGLGERPLPARRIEVRPVDRRTRLLLPGLIQGSGVDAVEAELVQQADDDVLRSLVVAGHGQCDAVSRALRLAPVAQVGGVDIVER